MRFCVGSVILVLVPFVLLILLFRGVLVLRDGDGLFLWLFFVLVCVLGFKGNYIMHDRLEFPLSSSIIRFGVMEQRLVV